MAFIAFLMSLCDKRYSASQYSILSALMALSRVYIGPVAAWASSHLGWPLFFFVSFLIGFPGLLLLKWLRSRLDVLQELDA